MVKFKSNVKKLKQWLYQHQITLFQSGTWLALLWISYLMFTPLEHPILVETNDKVGHFLAFFTLACLILLGWPKRPYSKTLFLLSLYAVFTESVQYFIPYRFFSLADIAADIIGAALFFLLIVSFKRWFPSYQPLTNNDATAPPPE